MPIAAGSFAVKLAYLASHMPVVLFVSAKTAWGPIMYLPAMPLGSWLMEAHGIRATVLLAVLLSSIGAGIRMFAHQGGYLFELVHIGQAFNGFAGPMIMQPPPRLSAVWFPVNQRTTATAVGTMAPYVGSAVAFLAIPAITRQAKLLTVCAKVSSFFVSFHAYLISHTAVSADVGCYEARE